MREVLARLMDHYGPQGWWPAASAFEVGAGAVLVQNASWRNAERAIDNLRSHRLLDPHRLLQVEERRLHELLRPSGTYKVKTTRLLALSAWWAGLDMAQVASWTDAQLRQALLRIRGVGPETADCIALYAFTRPVLVIDTYARRLLDRLGRADAAAPYESLRARLQAHLPADARWLNEAHAVIVAHAKSHCGARPRCTDCVLREGCRFGRVRA